MSYPYAMVPWRKLENSQSLYEIEGKGQRGSAFAYSKIHNRDPDILWITR